MKLPCCSVCHSRYDETERTPLLLHCGHGFCKACLSKMFSASPDTTLSCPRCRHPTNVGNSIHSLKKNFPILSLLCSSPSSPSFECDFTEDDEDDDEEDDGNPANGDDDEYYFFGSHRRRRPRQSHTMVSGCCSSSGSISSIDFGIHHNLKLLKKIGQGHRVGHDTWSAMLSAGSSSSSVSSSSSTTPRCRHQVVAKRVLITGDTEGIVWMQNKLEELRRKSMWCRNVCTFHGVMRMDGYLCLIMDRYNSSIQSEMQQNKGRLTLEQILRFVCIAFHLFFLFERGSC